MFAGVLRYPLRPFRCHPTLHSRLKAFGSNSPESFHVRLNSSQNLLAFRLASHQERKEACYHRCNPGTEGGKLHSEYLNFIFCLTVKQNPDRGDPTGSLFISFPPSFQRFSTLKQRPPLSCLADRCVHS